jgi:hypothetical protein
MYPHAWSSPHPHGRLVVASTFSAVMLCEAKLARENAPLAQLCLSEKSAQEHSFKIFRVKFCLENLS